MLNERPVFLLKVDDTLIDNDGFGADRRGRALARLDAPELPGRPLGDRRRQCGTACEDKTRARRQAHDDLRSPDRVRGMSASAAIAPRNGLRNLEHRGASFRL